MADPRDDRVSSAYREMPGDGPGPALDAALMAAARRAVGSRPGVARRWQVPVSIAAVLALAVGVSLNVERETPLVVDGTPVSPDSAEYPVSLPAPEAQEPPAPGKPPLAPAEPSVTPAAKDAATAAREVATVAKEMAPARTATKAKPSGVPAENSPTAPATVASPATAAGSSLQSAPAAAAQPDRANAAAEIVPRPAASPFAADAVAPTEAAPARPQEVRRAKSESIRDSAAQEKRSAEAAEPPGKTLERIADLRARGLHDEADRALAQFRRAHPDYRIGEEWLHKVERR